MNTVTFQSLAPTGIVGNPGNKHHGMVTAVSRLGKRAMYQYVLHIQTPDGEALSYVLNRYGLLEIDQLIGKRDYSTEGRHELPEALPITITWSPRHAKATDSCWRVLSIRRNLASLPIAALQPHDVITLIGIRWLLAERVDKEGGWLAERFTGSLFPTSPTGIRLAEERYNVERPHAGSVRAGKGWG